MTWTKEQSFSILIHESKTKNQCEYNLGRSQLGVLGYSVEDYHKKCCSKYSPEELEELSKEYEKAIEKVVQNVNGGT